MPIGLILTSSIMCTWNELFILLLINMHLKVHLSTHNKPAPWIDATTKKLMYERDIFKKRVARSNSQADWMNYIRQLVTELIMNKTPAQAFTLAFAVGKIPSQYSKK